MTALFKKHFWIVHLTFIAALAWTTASTVSAVAGSKLFVVPVPPDDRAGSATDAVELGRVPADEDATQFLVDRMVFDLDPPEDEPDDAGEAVCGDGVCAEDEDAESCPADCAEDLDISEDDELEESQLPIQLMGTLVHDDSQTSMATLNIDGETKLAWIGSEFLEGQAKVMAIAPRHVVVKEGSELKLVRLWSKEEARQDRPERARPAARRTTRRARPTARKEASASDGVKKTGPYAYQIDREMLDEQLQDLSKLGSQARVVPNYRNGKYEGFKLVGVRPGSLYRSIGIRSGDVIKSINGRDIDSPNKALELFEKLKNTDNVQVDIERRGQDKKLEYDIQ